MNCLCFLILIFIFICILRYILKIRETFTSVLTSVLTSKYDYEFLNREDGFKILGNPDYFNHFNHNDYKLRGCTSNNVMEIYRKNITRIY